MKIIYFIFISSILYSQYTEAEVLKIIEDRDSQWSEKIYNLENLVKAQKEQMLTQATLITSMDNQIQNDSLVIEAKNKQIHLLSERDKSNEKLVKLVKPKWYEHKYLWFVIGFILGK